MHSVLNRCSDADAVRYRIEIRKHAFTQCGSAVKAVLQRLDYQLLCAKRVAAALARAVSSACSSLCQKERLHAIVATSPRNAVGEQGKTLETQRSSVGSEPTSTTHALARPPQQSAVGKRRKRGPNQPRDAFFFFRKAYLQQSGLSANELSERDEKMLAIEWRSLSAAKRQYYENRSQRDKQRYLIQAKQFVEHGRYSAADDVLAMLNASSGMRGGNTADKLEYVGLPPVPTRGSDGSTALPKVPNAQPKNRSSFGATDPSVEHGIQVKEVRVVRDADGRAGFRVSKSSLRANHPDKSSVAYGSGLRHHDMITEVNGISVRTWEDYSKVTKGVRAFKLTVAFLAKSKTPTQR